MSEFTEKSRGKQSRLGKSNTGHFMDGFLQVATLDDVFFLDPRGWPPHPGSIAKCDLGKDLLPHDAQLSIVIASTWDHTLFCLIPCFVYLAVLYHILELY